MVFSPDRCSSNIFAPFFTAPTTYQVETETLWSSRSDVYEYGSAANPEMAPIPVLVHPPSLHETGPTRVVGQQASLITAGSKHSHQSSQVNQEQESTWIYLLSCLSNFEQ